MQVIYTSNNFQSTETANLNLVIAVKENSCGVAIHTGEGKLQYLGYYNFIESLKDNEGLFYDFVRSQDLLRQKFKNTHIVLHCSKSTLIPNAVYDEIYTDSYLKHLYTLGDDEIVKAREVVAGEVQMVFCVDEHLFYPPRTKYSEAIIEPVSASYLRHSIKYHHNKLNVFFEGKNMFLIHAVSGKPVFFNSFKYDGVDEAVYFILNYYQAFNIEHQKLPIVLHGELHPQLKEMLNTYSGKSEFAPPVNADIEAPKEFEYSFLIDFTY